MLNRFTYSCQQKFIKMIKKYYDYQSKKEKALSGTKLFLELQERKFSSNKQNSISPLKILTKI